MFVWIDIMSEWLSEEPKPIIFSVYILSRRLLLLKVNHILHLLSIPSIKEPSSSVVYSLPSWNTQSLISFYISKILNLSKLNKIKKSIHCWRLNLPTDVTLSSSIDYNLHISNHSFMVFFSIFTRFILLFSLSVSFDRFLMIYATPIFSCKLIGIVTLFEFDR